MKRKIVSCLIGTMLAAVLATGCGNTENIGTESSQNSQQTEAEQNSQSSEDESAVTEEETNRDENLPDETLPETESESEEQGTSTEETDKKEEPADTEKPETETKPATKPESTEKEESKPESTEKEEVSKPEYTYKDMNKTMYAKSSVNVRDLPSTDGEKLGKLSKADEVIVTGQCKENGWYRIKYKDKTGYVSSKYIVAELPKEEVKEDIQEEKPDTSTEKEESTESEKEEVKRDPYIQAALDAGYYKVVPFTDSMGLTGYTVLVDASENDAYYKKYGATLFKDLIRVYLAEYNLKPGISFGGILSDDHSKLVSCVMGKNVTEMTEGGKEIWEAEKDEVITRLAKYLD